MSDQGGALPTAEARKSLFDDADGVVGEGPDYVLMRAEARRLLPLFAPAGVENSQPSWGLGLSGTVAPDGDLHRVWLPTEMGEWNQKALGRETRRTLRELRATAISLLVYCEAHDE